MPGRKLYQGKTKRRLCLGEWLARLGIPQGVLAKAVNITPTHVSELISRRKNPSPELLLAISDFLGITVNELYLLPPSKEAMERARDLSPAQQALLARLLSPKG